MHVPAGVLEAPVLVGGGVAAAAGVAVGLYALDDRAMVKVAVLSAAFFVASLIHVPVGPASAHLVMNGLAGLILGWAVFPAVAVALCLHAVLFGFGGLTTLGVNIVIMALPGLVCYYALGRAVRRGSPRVSFWVGFACGFIAISLGGLLLSITLLTGGKEFTTLAGAVMGAHVPVMLIEGFVTGSAVVFLRKVRPETFHGAALPAAGLPEVAR